MVLPQPARHLISPQRDGVGLSDWWHDYVLRLMYESDSQDHGLALHFATDLLSDALRKNGPLSGGYQRRIQTQQWRPMQPAEPDTSDSSLAGALTGIARHTGALARADIAKHRDHC